MTPERPITSARTRAIGRRAYSRRSTKSPARRSSMCSSTKRSKHHGESPGKSLSTRFGGYHAPDWSDSRSGAPSPLFMLTTGSSPVSNVLRISMSHDSSCAAAAPGSRTGSVSMSPDVRPGSQANVLYEKVKPPKRTSWKTARGARRRTIQAAHFATRTRAVECGAGWILRLNSMASVCAGAATNHDESQSDLALDAAAHRRKSSRPRCEFGCSPKHDDAPALIAKIRRCKSNVSGD